MDNTNNTMTTQDIISAAIITFVTAVTETMAVINPTDSITTKSGKRFLSRSSDFGGPS